MKSKSDFGKGLVACLILFAQHIGKLEEMWWIVADYEENKRLPEEWEMSLEIWKTFDNLLSSRIVTWANGATDHLYEIEVPKGKEWSAIRKKIKELQDVGIQMGHGFTGQIYTLEDVDKLIKLANGIAIDIDKKIGLNPDIGEWN